MGCLKIIRAKGKKKREGEEYNILPCFRGMRDDDDEGIPKDEEQPGI